MRTFCVDKKLKETITTGQLGAARAFNANFCVNGTAFCKTEEDYIKLAAIHYVDLMRFLFGEVTGLVGYKNVSGAHISQCFSLQFDSRRCRQYAFFQYDGVVEGK